MPGWTVDWCMPNKTINGMKKPSRKPANGPKVSNSQTMPFDTGTMQGSLHTEQFDAADESHVVLQTDGPQARRLYFHPEYNFQRGKNPNAGAAWYGPYEAGGAKESFIPDTFAARMKEKVP